MILTIGYELRLGMSIPSVSAYKPDDNAIYRKKGVTQDDSDSDDQQSSSHEDKPEKFSSLGRSASVYLQKIQKIFEKA